MKKKLLKKNLIYLVLLFIIPMISASAQKKMIILVEEDRSFWDSLLSDNSIKNKNLLYASYIAYKDNLNDLSIETFQECIKTNSNNNATIGICNYYIGKNLYLIGKYREAITQFALVNNYDLAKYSFIKLAAMLNTAITYYNIDDIDKFRQYCQNVISEDIQGDYKAKALDLLSEIQ